MRLFSVATAVCVSLLSAAGAGWCYHQAVGLRSEADWLLARGQAQAVEYAQSFDGALADQQLESFARRRTVLEQAHLWQRGQVLGVVLAVVAAACAWVLSVLRRLEGQLVEASAELEPLPAEPRPPAAPASVQPARR